MPLIIPANTLSGGYEVANSCRFNDGDSAYLEKNFSSTQDSRRKFTVSAWVKRSDLITSTNIWGSSEGSGEGYNSLKFENHKLQYLSGNTTNSGTQVNLETNRLFRDVSAWYHIVLAVDTSQGTDTNRIKLYVNGTQETSFNTSTYPSQDTDLLTSTTPQMTIGMRDLRGTNAQFFDGYISEFCFIDNQQLTPSSFGEFDEDSPTIWKPIDVSGLTFGNNGFYLDFEDSSNLGNDANGGTDFTEVNLTATDQATDTPTNNFATFNPLIDFYPTYSSTLSNGNLSTTRNDNGGSLATIMPSQGKWYMEAKCGTVATYNRLGVVPYDKITDNEFNPDNKGVSYQSDGDKVVDSTASTYGSTYTTGDIIGIALNLDDGEITFYKNGVAQNSGTAITGFTYDGANSLTVGGSGSTWSWDCNFGSPPYAISSGNADANGYGNFEYSVPSGYYSLCTKNLAEFG
jgi:hypothetical protein